MIWDYIIPWEKLSNFFFFFIYIWSRTWRKINTSCQEPPKVAAFPPPPPNPKDSKLLAYKNQVQFLHFNFPPPPQKTLIWHRHILHYKKNCGKGEGVGIVYNHKMQEISRNWERNNYLSKDPLCWNHYWEWKPIQVLPSIGNTIHLFH